MFVKSCLCKLVSKLQALPAVFASYLAPQDKLSGVRLS